MDINSLSITLKKEEEEVDNETDCCQYSNNKLNENQST